ncbi:uncharacterized protein LOC121762221 [Salvia splendens]|uniref:uncharacterized protein LOC121762221 n=1 Tax=Salvia splendens TaxID=180675 RepID=UPI001C27F947|nr:uncharacterized protein LOC121762221 [Salvia splendens]
MSECYNNVLRGVRELPIRALVDLTFWRTVKWWVEKKTTIEHTEDELTPWARDRLAKNDSKGRKHYITVIDRDIGKYHVRTRGRIVQGVSKGNNVQIVRYLESSCSCGKWQMWRIPCSHACAVARDRGHVMIDLIDEKYYLGTWRSQYYSEVSFDAPRHEVYWVAPSWKLCITPQQLIPRTRGRVRRRRILNQMDVQEEDEPRAPRRCRNCGIEGHDRRNCSAGAVQ